MTKQSQGQRLGRWLVWGVMLGLIGCADLAGDRQFEQGLRQYERERFERAAELFRRVASEATDAGLRAYAYHYLGDIAWRQGDGEQAARYFEQSQEQVPTLFEPAFNLGVLALAREDWVTARAYFQAAANLQPRDARPWEYMAKTYQGEAGRRDARRALFEARDRAPRSPRILTRLALLEFADGDLEQAVSFCLQALERDPQYKPALYNLGRIYAEWPEERHHAIAYFQQYIEVAGTSERALSARQQVADLRRRPSPTAPQLEEDEPDDEPAEADGPVPPTWRDRLATLAERVEAGETQRAAAGYLALAAQARQQGQRDREEEILRTAVEQLPDSARLHTELGRHYLDRDRPTDALPTFQRAVELDAESSQAWLFLAAAASSMQEYDQALDALTRASRLQPNDPGPLWRLATLYDQAGADRRAIETYETFQARFPRDPRVIRATESIARLRPPPPEPEPAPPPEPAVTAPSPTPEQVQRERQAQQAFERGMAYQRARDWASARLYFSRATSLDPTRSSAFYQLGVVEYQLGNLDAARAAFQQTLELSARNVMAWYNLGLVEHGQGATPEAITALRRAFRLNRDHVPTHLLLGIIYAADPSTHGDARYHYQRVLELDPENANAPALRQWLATH